MTAAGIAPWLAGCLMLWKERERDPDTDETQTGKETLKLQGGFPAYEVAAVFSSNFH